MRIVLVRHGQTVSNVLGALDTVRPGAPLSAVGFSQAEHLARRWEDEVAPPPSVLAVSPLTRTKQTCRPLCDRYSLTPLVRRGIRELRCGDVEMNFDAVAERRYVEVTGAWSHGRLERRMEGAENGREALARALPVVAEVAALTRIHGDDAVGVLVIHGALTRLLAATLADNISGSLVMTHFMRNTGTVVLDWPADLDVEGVDGLVGALHALTWNDQPVDSWPMPRGSGRGAATIAR